MFCFINAFLFDRLEYKTLDVNKSHDLIAANFKVLTETFIIKMLSFLNLTGQIRLNQPKVIITAK